MAAPERTLRFCVLVVYPGGLPPPYIGVYALVDPSDENEPGLRMRVERCEGSGCSGFAFRGYSNGLAFRSPAQPQTEFIDTATAGTVYRYRARMENDDGVSAYSGEVEVETTISGTAGCDGGSDPGPGSPPLQTGKARYFSVSDRLNTGLHLIKGATDATSIFAWISTESGGGSASSLLGVVHQFVPNNRLEFKAEFSNVAQVPRLRLDIQCSGAPSFRTINTQVGPVGASGDLPFWRGKGFFVGFVNDVPNNRARFFWGLTAATIVEVPVTDFLTVTTPTFITEQWTDPAVTLQIGATGREGLSNPIFPVAQAWWNGIIDSVGLEFDTVLTLDQLKLRAQCGLGAAAGPGKYYWPINGTNPEPGIIDIVGTTVVEGLCQAALGSVQVEEYGLNAIVEYTLSEVQELGLNAIVEYWASPADMPGAGPGDTEPGGAGPNTGPDPDRFPGPNPPPYLDGSGSKNIFIYYSHTWEYARDPLDVTRHDSFELDFNWAQWKFARRLWVAGVGAQPITLQIWVDEVLRFVTTFSLITSSGAGWERTRIDIPPNCVKGQLFRFIMTSMAAFKIFMDQSTVEWHPLSGDKGYQETPLALSAPQER